MGYDAKIARDKTLKIYDTICDICERSKKAQRADVQGRRHHGRREARRGTLVPDAGAPPAASDPSTSSSGPSSRSSPSSMPARVRIAVERGAARVASASLDTEGYRVVDHAPRARRGDRGVDGARARSCATCRRTSSERGDLDRALVVRLSAFGEAPSREDIAARCSASRG